ncbi:hypothetical protein [Streptomyces sp. NPDC021622]|uniref:hypothetical protein n=1 Tax=Streptomyces sp. NPDC021622 TaxID=3155013 RepID=UPI003402E1E6
MSTHPHPPLKSVPALDAPQDAPRPVDAAAVGEPKDAARQGVVTALRPDQQSTSQVRHNPDDPTPQQPGIRIYAPPVYRDHYDGARWSTRHGDTPDAAFACPCGLTDTAAGARQVARLVALWDVHRATCTGTPAPHEEGRAAA